MGYRKYGNRKTVIDNITFDSKAEADYYCQLKLLERAGKISDLRLQPKYELIPKQKGERAVHYIADFEFAEKEKTVVVDVKGMKTKDYILKRKLFKQLYGDKYEFREVTE